MNRKTYEAVEAHMLICMQDAAHDKEHIYRVLWACLDIAQAQATPVDRDVLVAAALLHDIGRQAQFDNPALCHAQVGSGLARDFLLGRGWSGQQADHVAQCILTHRFRSDCPPVSLEAKILFDADKLDVTGAMGIARTLFYGGAIAQPLYFLDEAGRPLTDPQSPPSFFREYQYKLRNIADGLYTQRAKELAAQRGGAAAAYYDALYQEVASCYEFGHTALSHWLEEEL